MAEDQALALATETVDASPASRPGELDRTFDDVLTMLGERTPAAPAHFDDLAAAFLSLHRELAEARVLTNAGTVSVAVSVPDAGAGQSGDVALSFLDAAYEQAESQAGSRYGQSPEWQRIRAIRDAARVLWDTTRVAAGSYLEELAADGLIRSLFVRMAYRACQAIAQLSFQLATRLNANGQHDTIASRALWRLHRSADSHANRLTRPDPPADEFDTVLAALRDLRGEITDVGLGAAADVDASAQRGRTPAAFTTALDRLQDAYDSARSSLADRVAGSPAWTRLTSVWEASRELWRQAATETVVPRSRTTLARGCDLIADAADDLATRLDANALSQPEHTGARALIRLANAVDEVSARLRGYTNPADTTDPDPTAPTAQPEPFPSPVPSPPRDLTPDAAPRPATGPVTTGVEFAGSQPPREPGAPFSAPVSGPGATDTDGPRTDLAAPRPRGAADPDLLEPSIGRARARAEDAPADPSSAQPYASRAEATDITLHLVEERELWRRTGAAGALATADASRPAAEAFEHAWREAHERGLDDGPAPAGERYQRLADTGRALLAHLGPEPDSQPARAALQQLTRTAQVHAGRLRATAHRVNATPAGTEGAAAPGHAGPATATSPRPQPAAGPRPEPSARRAVTVQNDLDDAYGRTGSEPAHTNSRAAAPPRSRKPPRRDPAGGPRI